MSGIIVNISFVSSISFCFQVRGCHGCDRMVVGFTTTYAIDYYHHWWRGVQYYAIKFTKFNKKMYALQCIIKIMFQ
jgi:hypothetical protein